MKSLKSFVRIVPDFPKTGISFKDISPLLADASAFNRVIKTIAKHWDGKIDAIAALDARGFVFGSALALHMNLPVGMVRKQGKLPGETYQVSYGLEYGQDVLEIQVDAFQPGARVLVIDDLLATGGTAAAACSLVEQTGATVAGCAFVIELLGLGGCDALVGYDIDSLITY